MFLQRGLSIKASPLTLVLQDVKNKSFLFNVFDTPGECQEITARCLSTPVFSCIIVLVLKK